MVIGLEARLVAGSMLGWHGLFSPVALGEAYEHHIGKALHLAAYLQLYTKHNLLLALVNCKARMVGYQYDSFLCCSWVRY